MITEAKAIEAFATLVKYMKEQLPTGQTSIDQLRFGANNTALNIEEEEPVFYGVHFSADTPLNEE